MVSSADPTDVHRGLIVRGDCCGDGLLERYGCFTTQPRSQPAGKAISTLPKYCCLVRLSFTENRGCFPNTYQEIYQLIVMGSFHATKPNDLPNTLSHAVNAEVSLKRSNWVLA